MQTCNVGIYFTQDRHEGDFMKTTKIIVANIFVCDDEKARRKRVRAIFVRLLATKDTKDTGKPL